VRGDRIFFFGFHLFVFVRLLQLGDVMMMSMQFVAIIATITTIASLLASQSFSTLPPLPI
jgi:hypothetical protein